MRALVMTAAVMSMACLWDYDTLKEEALGQDEVVAILNGDLHKHSQAFYAAKVTYTRDLIANHDKPPPHLDDRYDDLAVAQAKLGDFAGALATLDAKDKQFPNAYTTHANRGTVLAMKGDVAGALVELKAAIAINPDAHFGREKFQIQLLEYLQKKPGLDAKDNFLGIGAGAWAGESATIIRLEQKAARGRKKTDLDPAVTAIAGLVRFGDAQDSPFVWEALGWALVRQGDSHLAMRAFRRAELLGMARAAEDGTTVASAIKANNLICCEHAANNPKLVALWTRLAKEMDTAWAAGRATDTKRQASEDALVGKQKYRDAFGY